MRSCEHASFGTNVPFKPKYKGAGIRLRTDPVTDVPTQTSCRKLIRDHQTEESVFARTLEMDNGRTDERLSGHRHWRGRVKIKVKVCSESYHLCS